jgi:hypothetical protein
MFFSPALFSALAVLFVNVVSAGLVTTTLDNVGGTPDGLPPSEETICDLYDGQASGLCVAFCEAKDCDIQYHKSCDQIKENWIKVTGETTLPCEHRCPCWDWGELDRITNDNIFSNPDWFGTSCSNYNYDGGGYINLLFSDQYVDKVYSDGFLYEARGYGVLSGRCISVIDYGSNFFSHSSTEQLSSEDYEMCANDIANRCAELGFD